MSQFGTPAMPESVHTPLSGQLPAGSQQQVLSQSNVLNLYVEALGLNEKNHLTPSQMVQWHLRCCFCLLD